VAGFFRKVIKGNSSNIYVNPQLRHPDLFTENMNKIGLSFLCLFSAFWSLSGSPLYAQDATLLYEFVSLNYTWDASHLYSDYLSSQKFIPENNLLAGINVDSNGDIYLTVPRWRNGIPATLNKFNQEAQTLTPFPSWDIQIEGSTDYKNSLQNCQSMTINSKTHQMWVIEVGRRNFFSDDKSLFIDSPPGFWIVDLNNHDAIIDKFYFPSNIIDLHNSFLNDIALDENNQIAYFSDAWDKGAIIGFNQQTRDTYRYSGKSTQNDPSYSMIINGKNYGRFIFTTPIDGISLSEDGLSIYYSAVQGTKLYRIATAILKDFSLTNSDIDKHVELIGTKEPSDGIKYINGKLYWGALTTSNYHYLPISTSTFPNMTKEVIKSTEQPETMEWIDTFAIDLSTRIFLYFVSNRLDQYSVHSMDFTGAKGANMRIFKISV
jgi:hypothetical protein